MDHYIKKIIKKLDLKKGDLFQDKILNKFHVIMIMNPTIMLDETFNEIVLVQCLISDETITFRKEIGVEYIYKYCKKIK
jgi:hypothetical protein